MKKKIIFPFILVSFLIGCGDTESTDQQAEEERAFDQTVLAENLEIPWTIEKEDDTFYITEREGAVVQIENGQVTRQAVALDQVLSSELEAGLLGFVLAPDFSENQQAFAYYTYEGEEGPENRIVRLELAESTWTEVDVLIDHIPSGPIHHGGRLTLGPDGTLYATTGDAAVPELAQDLESLAGKILRIHLDGTIPEDNPFEDSPIYSYGHRNSQGLTWLEDGRMFASEHGDQANDEINLIVAGENYGWPEIEGDEEMAGMQPPYYTSGDETWAPSGMDHRQDKLYVAALRGNAVLEMNLETDEITALLTDYGRIRDVYIDEELLYFVTNNTDGRGEPEETDDRLIQVNLPDTP